MNNKNNSAKLIQIALLIAIEIVLSRFLSIATPIVKISFAFLPIAIIAILYGPIYSGIAGGAADFIGAWLFPIGPYFPGFTITAALTGVVYGIVLYKKPKTWLKIATAVVFIAIALNLCLDTYWLKILFNKAYLALLPTRIIKSCIMIPLQIITIKYVNDKLLPLVNKNEI